MWRTVVFGTLPSIANIHVVSANFVNGASFVKSVGAVFHPVWEQ
jgi:hypothetical protein